VRRIASRGGRASHGGRGGDYDDDRNRRSGNSSWGGDNYGYNNTSRSRNDYDSNERGRGGNRGSSWMDEGETRRSSSWSNGYGKQGVGYDWDSEEGRESGYLGGQARGNRSRSRDYDYDDDGGSRGGNRSGNRGGGRGFASMDRDEVRRIAAKGGHMSHGGRGGSSDYDDDRRGSGGSRGGSQGGSRGSSGNSSRGGSHSGSRSNSSGGSRGGQRENSSSRGGGRSSGKRGFAALSKEERSRISAMGGHASHGGGRGR
jgi:hypothetical protein